MDLRISSVFSRFWRDARPNEAHNDPRRQHLLLRSQPLMGLGIGAVQAERLSLARIRGQTSNVQAASNGSWWYSVTARQMLPLASDVLQRPASLILCSHITMRLLFAARLSLLNSDHLFWAVSSAARRVNFCVRSCFWSTWESQVRCCSQSPTRFLAHTCRETKNAVLFAREAAVSLFSRFNSARRTSVLAIASRLIAAGGFRRSVYVCPLVCLPLIYSAAFDQS
jgi:hypothetical protein